MALVIAKYTHLGYIFVDREDTRTDCNLKFAPLGAGVPPITLDTIEGVALGTFGPFVPGGFWTALQDLSDCAIGAANIGINYTEADLASRSGAGEAEQKGNFQFEDANGDFFTLTIPDPPETILAGNQEDIDPAHADVAAFVAEVLDTAGDADVRTRNDVAPIRLVKAWKSHRESYIEKRIRKG
jgi:hypothetical protein